MIYLVHHTSPVLRTPATRVENVAHEVTPYLDEMRELMHRHRGLGLSAPQVGIGYQFFITKYDGMKLMINPKIVDSTGDNVSKIEGCLSFPRRTTYVKRPEKVCVEWMDSVGNFHKEWVGGLEARVIQHEMDHLNGICIF